jgi:hypothetical protein
LKCRLLVLFVRLLRGWLLSRQRFASLLFDIVDVLVQFQVIMKTLPRVAGPWGRLRNGCILPTLGQLLLLFGLLACKGFIIFSLTSAEGVIRGLMFRATTSDFFILRGYCRDIKHQNLLFCMRRLRRAPCLFCELTRRFICNS